MRTTSYPSDISREQFQTIQSELEAARIHTKPRTVDLYEAFCGVLYILKGGCQWRMLPSDFPKWRTVYNYWHLWSTSPPDAFSLLDRVLKKIGWRGPYQPWSAIQNQSLYH